MNIKTTYILFGILLVALLGFVAFQFWGGDTTKGKAGDFLFADFNRAKDPVKVDDIDSVRLERTTGGKKETVVFAHGKDGWRMEEPYRLRADGPQVDRLVREVTGATREKSQMEAKLSEYGLDDPSTVVTLKKGDQEWKLNVGKSSPGEAGVVYVSDAAKPKEPAAVRKSSLGSVFEKLSNFRSKDLLTANAANTTAVRLEGQGHALALEKTGTGAWRFEEPRNGPANFESSSPAPSAFGPKKVGGVRDLLDDAGGLRVETDDDFVAEGVSDGDLGSKYGLDKDKPETLRVEVKTKGDEDKAQVLLIGKKHVKDEEKKDDKKDEKKPDDKKPETKPEYYYVRLDGESAVERVPAAKVKPLLDIVADPEPLRSHDLVTTGTGKIDLIDMKAGGNSVKLSLADGKWSVYHGTNRPADMDAINALLKGLTGEDPFSRKKEPVVQKFVPKDDGLGFDNKDAPVVSVWVDGLKKDAKKETDEEKKDDKKDEKKDDKEPQPANDKAAAVKLTFGKHDKDKKLVYVKRESGGDSTIVMVSDGLLDRVTNSYLAYLDHKVPSFNPPFSDATKDVTKVTIKHGGQTREVTQEKSGDKMSWKFAAQEGKPARTANTSGVDEILRELCSLRAQRFVAERPGDTDLDKLYGLKDPSLSVTVTVKKGDKTEDWGYSFGKDTEYTTPLTEGKKEGVYAKMSNSDLVFVVDKAVVGRLTGAELRDLTVFDFDMKQVKGAKITVWSNDLGGPITLDLERKGEKDWTKKDGPITPDGTKVENFVSGLSHLQATKFAAPEAGTDTGLDVKKKALELVIATEGGPQELTVGNEDPKNKGFLFAKSNKVDETFLVPEVMFKDAKAGPAYFRK
jgi:hypothetical protein